MDNLVPSRPSLPLQLGRLRGHLRPPEGAPDSTVADNVMRVLRRLYRDDGSSYRAGVNAGPAHTTTCVAASLPGPNRQLTPITGGRRARADPDPGYHPAARDGKQ
ncbi:hypothetical protein AB5J55_37325 [Streptomyces sp. R11]|uniref:Uncharacterized protein n=1 Tax=Streptomyces sp. R11 TaxID=3238625 RepID=A0AB39N8U9_9ACTN